MLGRLGYGLNICYEIINSLVIELFSAVNNDKIVERICVATVAFMLHYLSIPCPHVAAAAAAAKSLQSCPTLVQPHRRQPIRLRHPWDSLGKITGVGCHFLLQCMKLKSESEVAQSCPTLSDPMDCSPPVSSAHGIFQARVLEWGAIAFSYRSLQSME